MNPFQLLVAAIITITLMFLFFSQFSDFFLPPSVLKEKIAFALDQARLSDGRTIPIGRMDIRENDSFSAAGFLDSTMDLLFECNNPEFCCARNSDCSLGTFWDGERISFKKKIAVDVFARCEKSFDLFICTVFFGKSPGQLDILDSNAASLIDLSTAYSFPFELSVKNSGSYPVLNGLARLELFSLSEGLREQMLVREIGFSELLPGQSKQMVFDVQLNRQGSWEAVFSVSGDRAGKATKKISFVAVNEQLIHCKAQLNQPIQTVLDEELGKCVSKFFCADCSLGSQCLKAWQKADPEKVFEEGDFSFAEVWSDPVNGLCE